MTMRVSGWKEEEQVTEAEVEELGGQGYEAPPCRCCSQPTAARSWDGKEGSDQRELSVIACRRPKGGRKQQRDTKHAC